LVLALANFAVCSDAAVTAEASPEEILKLLANVYASAKSYKDTAIGTQTFLGQTWSSHGSTAYLAPNQFRLEFAQSDGTGHKIFWVRGSDVREWNADDGVKRLDDLGDALARATGAGDSSANIGHWIPAMLFDHPLKGNLLPRLKEPRRLADDPVNGHPCYRIEGTLAVGTVTVWIDQSSYLVRRVDERSAFEQASTIYQPELNGAIDPKLLEFNAPSVSKQSGVLTHGFGPMLMTKT
jgi:hypothetical protein